MHDLKIVIIARLVQIITAFATLRVMTTQLVPEEVGKISVILAIAMFFTLIFVSPIGNYTNRQLNTWFDKGILIKRFLQAGVYYLGVTFIAIITIMIGYEYFTKTWHLALLSIVALVSGFIFIKSMSMSLVTAMNILGHRKYWAIYTILTLWLSLLAAWMFTQFQAKAEFWLLGQIVGFFVVAVLAFYSLYKINCASLLKKQKSINEEQKNKLKPLLTAVLVFALPLSVSTGLNWVQFQSYRLVLGDLISLSYLGMFTVGYAISAGVFNAFESTAQQYFYPGFYKQLEQDKKHNVRDVWVDYASIMLPLIIFTGVIVIILAVPLTHLLLNEKYWISSQFVILGALVEAGRVAGNVYGLAGHGTKDTKILVIPHFFGALSILVLVPILTKFFGIDGAMYSLVAASSIYVCLLHFTIKRHMFFSFQLFSLVKPYLYIFPALLLLIFLSKIMPDSIIYNLVLLFVGGVIYLLTIYKTYQLSNKTVIN